MSRGDRDRLGKSAVGLQSSSSVQCLPALSTPGVGALGDALPRHSAQRSLAHCSALESRPPPSLAPAPASTHARVVVAAASSASPASGHCVARPCAVRHYVASAWSLMSVLRLAESSAASDALAPDSLARRIGPRAAPAQPAQLVVRSTHRLSAGEAEPYGPDDFACRPIGDCVACDADEVSWPSC